MNTIIGEKVRRLRTQKGLSQEQVAEHLHISQSTYARIEKGDSNSWVNYLEPICTLFEIQLDELLKLDSVTVGSIKNNNGAVYNTGVINQLSEKLIAQYEENARLKDTIIADLRTRLAKYEG
ncbi:MAG: helix-turn-helix domain-containing protein [Winogradskyella sp.]|uniref:helix-turn-helix domain-containing protein n=1 Tax=Winogradskyella sp. TaxID=1883156 RepID=UPI0017F556F3|nr:helix-turn-helix transcriptional regulator [Winogradskyella sp.]MBT8244644.1 helix-turn-helix domain-containing protein [Winogradskyella sp.]NNK23132.1 helix-turn-helix domain-containing protein [Winogradskyella sp.]